MSRQMRIWRSVGAAFIATGIATLFHLGAHGSASLLAGVVCFVLTLWIGVLLAGRRLGILSLSAIVAFAQLALHHLMTLFSHAPLIISGHSGRVYLQLGTGAGSGAHAHHMTDAEVSAAVADTAAAAGQTAAHAGAGTSMLIAHLLSAVVTIAILKCGEEFVFALIQAALGPIATAFTRFVPLVMPPRLPVQVAPLLTAVTSAVLDSRFRRGPPAVLFTRLRALTPA